MKNFRFLHFSLAFLLMVGSSGAQSEEWFGFNTDGFYLGAEAGVMDQDDFGLEGRSNGFPTRCDQILFEDTRNNRQNNGVLFHDSLESDNVSAFLNELRPGGDCERGADALESDEDAELDTGAMVSFQMGYRFNPNVRVELEYMYRAHTDGDVAPVSIRGGKDSEFPVADQGITALSSHSTLVNLYWDFINDSAFTPYVGIGGGSTKMRLDYSATFTRHEDPDRLDAPGEAAGTTSLARETLRDSVFTWQLLAGVDYAIDPNWLVGVKARYVEYSEVKDGKSWNQLRSHDSRIVSEDFYNGLTPTQQAQIGDPTVRYEIETEDAGAWAIGVGVKRLF